MLFYSCLGSLLVPFSGKFISLEELLVLTSLQLIQSSSTRSQSNMQ